MRKFSELSFSLRSQGVQYSFGLNDLFTEEVARDWNNDSFLGAMFEEEPWVEMTMNGLMSYFYYFLFHRWVVKYIFKKLVFLKTENTFLKKKSNPLAFKENSVFTFSTKT